MKNDFGSRNILNSSSRPRDGILCNRSLQPDLLQKPSRMERVAPFPHLLRLAGSSSLQNVRFSQAQSTVRGRHSPPSGSLRARGALRVPETQLCLKPCPETELGLAQRTRIRHADFLPDEVICNTNVPPPSQLHCDRRDPQKCLMCLLLKEKNAGRAIFAFARIETVNFQPTHFTAHYHNQPLFFTTVFYLK